MLKVRRLWSVGVLKAAARKEVKAAQEAAARRTAEEKAAHKVAKKSAVYDKYQQKKRNNPIVEFIKIDLSEECFNQSIALYGREVVQCEHCSSVTFEGHKHIGKSGFLFTCPKCGKVSSVWPHYENAILVPSYMTVKKYQNGATTVNCFAVQYIVYQKYVTTANGEKDCRLFLAKNKGVGQVIFAANGQTYVKPFRSLKSGRALHTAAGVATKFEAAKYENITYQGNEEFTFHYTRILPQIRIEEGVRVKKSKKEKDSYNFYDDYIRVLEDRGIIPFHSKLAHRFPYLDKKDIIDLFCVQERVSNIEWRTSDGTSINMWNVLKKKIGTLPRDITSKELKEKVSRYYQRFGSDTLHLFNSMESLLILYLFKRFKVKDIDLFQSIYRSKDFSYLARTLEPNQIVRKNSVAISTSEYYEDTRVFDEEVPW